MIYFFIKNEKKFALIFGIFLVSLVSFTFGVTKSKKFNYEPLIISIPENPPVIVNSQGESIIEADDNKNPKVEVAENTKTCLYVGSKNGTKYYPPSCEYAKKIKSENLRCFSSDEEAKSKGYTKTSSCN